MYDVPFPNLRSGGKFQIDRGCSIRSDIDVAFGIIWQD
jgi:hypothetical protein